MIPVALALTQHDDLSAEMAMDVVLALRKADISDKAASFYMWRDEKHVTELSHALAGRRSLNLYLLARLPASFWVAFMKIRARRLGWELVEYGVLDVLREVRAFIRRDDTKGAA